ICGPFRQHVGTFAQAHPGVIERHLRHGSQSSAGAGRAGFPSCAPPPVGELMPFLNCHRKTMKRILFGSMLVVVLGVTLGSEAGAAVLCKSKNGTLALCESCARRQVLVDLAALQVDGPRR